ncbi:hypothetical protein K432DRAFT_310835, partial [Lepidopterella palustris CBS 459.81]
LPRKIILYISLYLKSIYKQFRINGAVILENYFTGYFFKVFNILRNSILEIPTYFLFLTFIVYYISAKKCADITIFKIGINSKYNLTNLVLKLTIIVITRISIDYEISLGPTIKDIA